MAKNDNLKDFLVDVADAIRSKTGTSGLINPQDFSSKIRNIQTEGPSTRAWTGHADVEGLKAIGWDDDDIAWYQQNGVNWNEEFDACHKVTDDNKALYGVMTADNKDEFIDRVAYFPKIDISGLTSLTGFFRNFTNLVAFPIFDTSNITDMSNMCHTCSSLVAFPPLNTSNVTKMGNICYNCVSLTTVAMVDTSKVIDLSGSFFSCYSLVKFPEWDTSVATTVYRMFYNCYSLVDVPFLNLTSCVSPGRLFWQCYALRNIDGLQFGNANTLDEIFKLDGSLTEVSLFYIGNSVSFENAAMLSKESILVAIRTSLSNAAIEIKLHPYTYSKYSADAEVVAALAEHPNVSIVSA